MTDKDIYQLTIDELAILWNKTKDEKYKKAWYEKVRKVYG